MKNKYQLEQSREWNTKKGRFKVELRLDQEIPTLHYSVSLEKDNIPLYITEDLNQEVAGKVYEALVDSTLRLVSNIGVR